MWRSVVNICNIESEIRKQYCVCSRTYSVLIQFHRPFTVYVEMKLGDILVFTQSSPCTFCSIFFVLYYRFYSYKDAAKAAENRTREGQNPLNTSDMERIPLDASAVERRGLERDMRKGKAEKRKVQMQNPPPPPPTSTMATVNEKGALVIQTKKGADVAEGSYFD